MIDEVFAQLKTNSDSIRNEAVRLLIKIAENILQDPHNLKIRILQKANSTIKNKVLATKGGAECLKLMGFQESGNAFVMHPTAPLNRLQEIKNSLSTLDENGGDATASTSDTKEEKPSNKIDGSDQDLTNDLDNVKRFVLPPYTMKFINPFLQKLEKLFYNLLALDDHACQLRAKRLIPLTLLEHKAQERLHSVQIRIKKEKLPDPEYSIQDMLLLELLAWFKEDFFSWVDSPKCEHCSGETSLSHMSTDAKDLRFAGRVEVYKCTICEKITKFPRYDDLNILLETRRGRCGEWAHVFTLLCRALGWDARFVMDELDHVWTEVYSVTQKRWLHCDPCENACDTPLMYETGWNKKHSYVIAYSPVEIQDVTWRYSSNHKQVLARRTKCPELELISALITLRKERQKTFTVHKRNYLTLRVLRELSELMIERKPSDNEKQGRSSGSAAWRLGRQEITQENQFIWKIGLGQIGGNNVTIKYSAALDEYQLVKANGGLISVPEWYYGVYEFKNIFRKTEVDWKTVYLARSEGADTGLISWRFEIDATTCKAIDYVSLIFKHKVFENGSININLSSAGISYNVPRDHEEIQTGIFSGRSQLCIEAQLSGGNGNIAWQHAQLFRQSSDDKDFPFVLNITFKDSI